MPHPASWAKLTGVNELIPTPDHHLNHADELTRLADAHDRSLRRLSVLDVYIAMPACFVGLVLGWIIAEKLEVPWWVPPLGFLVACTLLHMAVVSAARRRLQQTVREFLDAYPMEDEGFASAVDVLRRREQLVLRDPLLWRLDCLAQEFARQQDQKQDVEPKQLAEGD